MLPCLTSHHFAGTAHNPGRERPQPPPGNPYRQAQHRRIDRDCPVYNVGPVSVSILGADVPPPPLPTLTIGNAAAVLEGSTAIFPGGAEWEQRSDGDRVVYNAERDAAVAGSDIYPAATRHRERLTGHRGQARVCFVVHHREQTTPSRLRGEISWRMS